MGLAHSPKIVTDGLVFAMDTENDKSYKGPVMTNVTNQITPVGTGTANGYSFTASTERVFVPTVGEMTAQVNSGFNNYPSVSTNCCPSLFHYGYLTVLPSTLYTYGILYRTASGYSHPNFMYRYEYTSGAVYVTEAGVHSGTNRIDLGGGWYWAWGTFTTQATTALLQTYSFYYRYGTSVDSFYVADVMIAQGDYTKLHPRYWPDINTSRSNTQSIIDLTSRNNITTANLTYANTGSFSFDGVDDFIYLNSWNWPNPMSICFFIQPISAPGGIYSRIFSTGPSDNFEIAINSSRQLSYYTNTNGWSSNILTLDATWNFIAFSQSGTSVTVYKNGVPAYTGSLTTSAGSSLYVCSRHANLLEMCNARIAYVTIYNKTLSAAEVLQNFNSQRGRFGL